MRPWQRGAGAGLIGAGILISLLARAAHPAGRTVVSLTFDDATKSQMTGARILGERGLKATFYVNSGRINTSGYLSLSDLRSLDAGGHEVAGHTLTHQNLAQSSPSAQQDQICRDRENLVGWGFNPVSLAYPFGAYTSTTKQIARQCGYLSGRTVGSVGCPNCVKAENPRPADYFAVRTPDSVKADTTLAEMQDMVTGAERAGGGWVVIVMHLVCEKCDKLSVSPKTLADFADWLAARAPSGTVVETVRQVVGTPAFSDPAALRLSPESAEAGGRGFALTVDGSEFTKASTVLWNGSARATAFISPARLRASIRASDIASNGYVTVSVQTPGKAVSSGRFLVRDGGTAGAPGPTPSARPLPAPNPWRKDLHAGRPIVFRGLAPGSTVRLFTTSGRYVRTLGAPGGQAVWDLSDESGSKVSGGFFFFLSTRPDGERLSGIIAIIR